MLVKWEGSALDELADIYVTAEGPDKEVIAATAEEINAKLADDPAGQGESRTGRQRIWFPRPLVVLFEVNPTFVRVVRVGRV